MDAKALIIAALAGAVLPVQVGLNTALAKHGNGAIWAAMVSFGVGTIALAAVVIAQGNAMPDRAELAAAPWWAWVGGALGAFYVASTIWAAPRIGAVLLFALVVAGQMTMSSGLDHVGGLGLPVNPFGPAKLMGILMIVSGVVLIQR